MSDTSNERPQPEERPLVTFALFAYNQEKYIREAVEGAFAQTYEPLEIILSDDCSSDRTFEIMTEMVADYRGPHQVRTVKNTHNLGVLQHVLKRGKEASGSIVVMAAGDDISLPLRTTVLVNEIKSNKDCFAAFSRVHIIDENGNILIDNIDGTQLCSPPQLYLKEKARPTVIIQGSSAAYRKELFNIDIDITCEFISEDVLFSFLLNLHCRKIVNINSPLVLYRMHQEALINKPQRNTFSECLLKEEEEDMLGLTARNKARIDLYEKLSTNIKDRINVELMNEERRIFDIVHSWSDLSIYLRLISLITEVVNYKGRFAKWQVGRLFGNYPYYQPKQFISRFQKKRYRSPYDHDI